MPKIQILTELQDTTF